MRSSGFRRKQAFTTSNGVATVSCRRCSTEAKVQAKSPQGYLPPVVIVRQLKNLGWDLKPDKTKAICPGCQEKRKDTVTIKSQSSASEQRKIFNALETHFDEEKGAYAKGQSDQTIATHLNVPRKTVATLREDAFGPIKVDPGVILLEGRIDDALASLGKAETRWQEALDKLTAEISTVSDKITKLKEGKAL